MRKLLLLGLLACSNTNSGPPAGDSIKVANVHVKKFAFEAYPQWSAAHPDKACPAQLSELAPYVDNDPLKDPWGNSYAMFCGETLPAGAKGLAISSNGPDGKAGTADDIKSW